MLFVYFSTLLESILKSGLLPSALLAGENWVGIVGVGIVGVGIIAPTQFNDVTILWMNILVCGDFLDKKNWDGPRHKIIAGDAIQYLKDCQVK